MKINMKIKYVIISPNMDSTYYDYWPIISKLWNQIFNITPVLGLICNEKWDLFKDYFKQKNY